MIVAGKPEPMNREAPRILLVDDDPVLLQSYLRALSEYAPMHANSGDEACRILSQTTVDVVLCDLGMPGMGGLELMSWARSHCPHPLWIVVSGQGTFDAAAQALKLGAFDFVCKPILSPMQLRTTVANAVHRQVQAADRAVLVRSLEEQNVALREQQAMLDLDLQRAARILRALMPSQLGPLEHMQVNAAYRPSDAIGGDFYGATMLEHGRLAVYVADVAGHGVSAALLAVLFHQRLVAFNARDLPRSPATTLADLNRGLLEECRASGLFVTVAYALVDGIDRTVVLASAGHPPAIVLRRSGSCERLAKTGPALGLAPDASYEEHRITLAEGDRILLYTDGLTGAMSERASDLDFVLSALAGGTEDGAKVVARLVGWSCRAATEDDTTLVLLTASGGASTFDDHPAAPPDVAAAESCGLSVGSTPEQTWIAVQGPATWKDAAVMRATCVEALDAGRGVVVDLARCTLLDSTVLGTLHEVVVRAEPRHAVHVQGASLEIRALFEELAMTQVLASVVAGTDPVPQGMLPLRPEGDAGKHLVQHAHELLAELSASNAEQFQPVIDALRREAAHP